MKRTVFMIIPILICGIVFTDCGKSEFENKSDDLIEIEDGTYSGTFTVKYNYLVDLHSFSATTTLELKNGKYTCTGNSNRIPAGGSGNYSVNDSTIIFSDMNYWTCEFDHNLILNGEYYYIFDGKRLKFSKERCEEYVVNNYEYDLERE